MFVSVFVEHAPGSSPPSVSWPVFVALFFVLFWAALAVYCLLLSTRRLFAEARARAVAGLGRSIASTTVYARTDDEAVRDALDG